MMAVFEQKSERCHVVIAHRQCQSTFSGRKWKTTTAARAIKEEGEVWRIDFCDSIAGAWMPWEPINDESYVELTAAKAAIEAFLATEVGR